MAAPRAIVVPAVKKHTATVICLHGLGDTMVRLDDTLESNSRSFLAENWRRRGKFDEVSFIFPSAPTIPITMPGWYDITSFDTINRSEDEDGINKSRNYIYSLIAEQTKKGIPAKRVILGGFSQGGAMALFSGLTHPEKLGGVFGLSCYQLLESKFEQLCKDAGDPKPRVFMGHGMADPLVKFDWGKRTADKLKSRGFDVEFHAIPGLPHSADEREIDKLAAWVEHRLIESGDEPSKSKVRD